MRQQRLLAAAASAAALCSAALLVCLSAGGEWSADAWHSPTLGVTLQGGGNPGKLGEGTGPWMRVDGGYSYVRRPTPPPPAFVKRSYTEPAPIAIPARFLSSPPAPIPSLSLPSASGWGSAASGKSSPSVYKAAHGKGWPVIDPPKGFRRGGAAAATVTTTTTTAQNRQLLYEVGDAERVVDADERRHAPADSDEALKDPLNEEASMMRQAGTPGDVFEGDDAGGPYIESWLKYAKQVLKPSGVASAETSRGGEARRFWLKPRQVREEPRAVAIPKQPGGELDAADFDYVHTEDAVEPERRYPGVSAFPRYDANVDSPGWLLSTDGDYADYQADREKNGAPRSDSVDGWLSTQPGYND